MQKGVNPTRGLHNCNNTYIYTHLKDINLNINYSHIKMYHLLSFVNIVA